MATKLPPSLGDETETEFLLQHEEHPLPGSRKEIVARIETLLGAGGVQKLVIELGRPMHLYRLVKKEDFSKPPEDLPADDLWLRVRNGRVVEVNPPDARDAYQSLFFAFDALRSMKLKPEKLFVQTLPQLRKWMKLASSFGLSEVYGVAIEEQPNIPDDCVILVGVSYDEANTQDTTGLRVPMDDTPDKVIPLKESR